MFKSIKLRVVFYYSLINFIKKLVFQSAFEKTEEVLTTTFINKKDNNLPCVQKTDFLLKALYEPIHGATKYQSRHRYSTSKEKKRNMIKK